MLQMEISQVCISQLPAEKKMDLADDVMRLLQVREKNKEMTKDWLLFISTSNVKFTPGEIYLAFKMALSREILDSKGNEIDLFPELSNNATGKVIAAYLRFKNENDSYQKAKEKLKSLTTPKTEISETEIKKLKEDFLKMVFDEIVSNGYCSDAHHLFLELEKSGKLNISIEEKKKLYEEQLKIHIPIQKEEIRLKGSYSAKHLLQNFQERLDSGKPLTTVVNRCRDITVSNYLKDYLKDFETFKNVFES